MMRISINEHIEGDQTIAGDPLGAARMAGTRAWNATDARLDRLRSRLDQPRRVLLRDFLIFEVKQVLDSMKGVVIAHIAVAAFIFDMIRFRGKRTKVFYRVMDVGERLDHWLSLYGASRHAGEDPEGLFGESREGSPTMLGQLERVVHRVVVGSDADGELYPRTRTAPPSGAGGGWTAGAGAPSASDAGAASGPRAGAGGSGAGSSPAGRSSFEAENHGQGVQP
ncbi:MAG TPA: hypothetical protein VF832_16135 [Longimicrobiales bacterium]